MNEFQAKHREIQERLDRFRRENRTNPYPFQADFRLNAGFGTWENVALLIELGYEVYTKANNHLTVKVLHKSLVGHQAWQPVGEKSEMQSHKDFHPENFYDPVDVGLERFQHSPTVWKQSRLLHFGLYPVANNCKGWFDYYNGRQTLETAIKEDKHVFFLHHIKVRSIPAIILQEVFVLFAANFIG